MHQHMTKDTHTLDNVPRVQDLDFYYHVLLHYLLYPVHPHLLDRRWRYAMSDAGADPVERYLQDLTQWGWVDWTSVTVPQNLSQHVSPDIVGLTEQGFNAVQTLSPDVGVYTTTLDELGTPAAYGSPLKTWAEWAVGYALEAGNTVSGAPFRYEVRWTEYATYLVEVLEPDPMPDYWVQFWPTQGRKRPRISVYTSLSWTKRDDTYRDPRYVGLFRRWFTEELQANEAYYANLDALYWVALTPEVATRLAEDLDWFLTETQPPKPQAHVEPDPRPDVAIFTLDALLEHWLPAPRQLRRWQGHPPAQCRAARPAYFRQGE